MKKNVNVSEQYRNDNSVTMWLFYFTLVLFSLWEYDFSTVHSVIVLNFRNVMCRTVSLFGY
jgi:hypothetical protein